MLSRSRLPRSRLPRSGLARTRLARNMLARKIVAEGIGTALLVAGVVGSGIMAERLSDDVGVQLLANTFATCGVLVALILALGPLSGAHLNPVVTLFELAQASIGPRASAGYVAAQLTGGIAGTMLANAMFDLPLITVSEKSRSGSHQLIAEVVATFGLLLVIHGVVKAGRPTLAAATVAGWIGGAYWFTSSTSFANPAVTVARTMSNTFAGIAPGDAVGFLGAQLVAAALGVAILGWLFAPEPG